MWNTMSIFENSGIELSEHLAMIPAASVSALVFSHPKSQYFAVGKIQKDQVLDYAQRKNIQPEECARILAPIFDDDL